MYKENQMLVRKFYGKFDIKANAKTFGMALGQANRMLDKFTYDELDKAIDLLFLHQPKNGVYSFRFLEYVIDDLVADVRAMEQQNILEAKPMEIKEVKKVEVKNNFGKKGMVSF